MKRRVFLVSLVVIFAIGFTGCNYTSKVMKTPNNYVEFKKDDFSFSQQVVGEGVQTRILGVDWAHLFVRKTGAIDAGLLSIPVIGNLPLYGSEAYALWDVMEKNEGYDVVFYPQYETKITGIPILFTKSTTTVKARLGKIK